MFHVLHGENELLRQEKLTELLKGSDVPADFRDMNTEILEGTVSLGELRRACSVMPFLGESRIVIAYDVLGKSRKEQVREIVDYLSDLPPSTQLFFVERQTLSKRHPILKAAAQAKAAVHHFAPLKARDLPAWIRERVETYGATMEPQASALLAQNIGENLQLLNEEIKKLILYVGERKRITVDDVRVMVPYVQSADVIFDMVDAIGQRNPRRAVTYLHRLLEVGEHPLAIFGMIVRQFRLIIRVRWLADRRYPQQQIISRLKLHPFVAQKIQGQSTQFSLTQLREAYRILMEMDLAIKRGEIDAQPALDLLIAQLTRL